jgi:release factor glutamine methyltransferase
MLLAPDGAGIVEINEALGEETAEVFRSAGFTGVRVEKDLYEKDRFVCFFSQQTMKI